MKKQMISLGEAISREEQKEINGGYGSGKCLKKDALCHKGASYPHNKCCTGLTCKRVPGSVYSSWGTCR